MHDDIIVNFFKMIGYSTTAEFHVLLMIFTQAKHNYFDSL